MGLECLVGAILADRLHRAPFHGLAALGEIFGILGLLEDEGVSLVFGTGEIVGSRLAAEVTIDALAVHVELTGHIFHIFIFAVSHTGI